MHHNMERESAYTVPEGGRGYAVAAAVIIIQLNTLVPLTSFGLVHGEFLASIGKETTGTTTTVATFCACMSFAGVLAAYLFGKLSYGVVGLIGACINCTAAVLQIFVQDLPQFVICMGLLPGTLQAGLNLPHIRQYNSCLSRRFIFLLWALMTPFILSKVYTHSLSAGLLAASAYSSINEYFKKKLNLILGTVQVIIVFLAIVHSPIMEFCVKTIGYINTKIILALLTLLNSFAVWSIFPVNSVKKHSLENVNCLEENPVAFNAIKRNFNYTLLKSPRFYNIILVVACSFYTDNLFMPLLIMDLLSLKFSTAKVATLCMVYYGSDLTARIVYSLVSAIFSFRNRYLLYAGTLLSAICRIVFILRDDYIWRLVNLVILGFLRCSVETTYIPIISEEYRENFPTAYTLSILFGGIYMLALGPVFSWVKELTNDDDLVIQVLTVAQLIAVSAWSVEFAYKFIRQQILFNSRYKDYMLQRYLW